MPAPRRELVTLADAAHHLGISHRTLRYWIAEGRLTAYRVGPRLVRLDAREVDALVEPIPTVATRAAATRAAA